MRLSDLQYFIDVAEYGSMTHAADARGMSQPGLSRIVRELENRVKSRLLQRTGRGIELTPAGERFLEFAREAVAAFDSARQDIALLSPDKPAHLRVAIPIGMGGLLAPDLQRQFALHLPQIGIDVFEERTALATDATLMRHYDAVLTYGYDKNPPVRGEDLYQEDLHLVGTRDLIGENDTSITLRDAARLPLMLPPAGRFRTLIDNNFASTGLKPKITREFETAEAILAYVLEREGVAILPYSNIVGGHNEARLSTRLIVEPLITRRIRLLFGPTQGAHDYRQMLQMIRETLARIAVRVRWRALSSVA